MALTALNTYIPTGLITKIFMFIAHNIIIIYIIHPLTFFNKSTRRLQRDISTQYIIAVTKRREIVHIVIIQSSADYVLLSGGCAAALKGLTLIAVIRSEWYLVGVLEYNILGAGLSSLVTSLILKVIITYYKLYYMYYPWFKSLIILLPT